MSDTIDATPPSRLSGAAPLFAVVTMDTRGRRCYLTTGEGDPARTYDPKLASTFKTRFEAFDALEKAEETTPFRKRRMMIVPHPANDLLSGERGAAPAIEAMSTQNAIHFDVTPSPVRREQQTCSAASDTPETDYALHGVWYRGDHGSAIPALCRRLERERDRLRAAIEETLRDNAHLENGDNCTLIKLKLAMPPNGKDDR